MTDLRTTRWPTWLLLAIPLSLLAGAYIWLGLVHRTWNLWGETVHESGRYTLGQTIFFFRHFLREIPIDLAMGLICAAAVTGAHPTRQRRPMLAGLAGLAACALFALAFLRAAGEEGWGEALRDLFQFRTRDDDAAFGAHWNFHLLSTTWFCAAATAAAALWAGQGGLVRMGGRARPLFVAAWGWVVFLTVVFGVQGEVFTSPRYIGHQAREILTHGLITLPLTIAVLRWVGTLPSPSSGIQTPVERPRKMWTLLSWILVVGIPLFLIGVFRGTDFAATAQMQSALAGVVASHVFEHLLDIALVVSVGLAVIGRPPDRQQWPE